jgi:hypothetical protein
MDQSCIQLKYQLCYQDTGWYHTATDLEKLIYVVFVKKVIIKELNRRITMASKLHDDSIMPFGTHKDKKLGDIPDSYWLFFLKQTWCDKWPDLVEYANNCIEDDD